MNTGPGPVPASKKRPSTPDRRDDDCRERLIDATLELCTRQGYDATTPDQIAYAAGVEPSDFVRYFADTEAVILSIVDAMSHATATALADVEKDVDPDRALLTAGIAAVTAIAEGRGAVTLDRLLAMAQISNATRNLQRKLSAARKRVITQPLADWMGVDPQDPRVKRALTMWSAVAASAYVGGAGMPEDYDPRRDEMLSERIVANLSQSFGDVTGKDPEQSE
jgi:AcrR family transcriptional regulator